MKLQAEQYKTRGLALTFLAKKYFLLEPNDRVPTVEEFCKESNISQGTMQTAISILKGDGAITTRSRGHLGTFVEHINHHKLLSYLGNRTFVGSLPLPYTKKYEGLATGIYKAFLNSEIRVSLSYMNDSQKRLLGLQEDRNNFIITSGLTADYLTKKYKSLTEFLVLPKRTYVTQHVLIFRKGQSSEIKDGVKIGVDTNSIDYTLLTKYITQGHQVKLINMPYNQVSKSIEDGLIDFAVWNRDEIVEHNYPLDIKEINCELTERSSQAVFIGKKKDVFMKSIIQKTVNIENLLTIQKKVISGELLPEY